MNDVLFMEDDDKGKEVFRKWFNYVGELRSFFPSASILALSATCTKKFSRRVSKILNISSDAVILYGPPKFVVEFIQEIGRV